ncbi:hypothetical protein [Legionella sp.]|uniref:hypothetical protein n=1 Tax=Legionella sp. TaxID=459 RepID=UPI003CAB6CF2
MQPKINFVLSKTSPISRTFFQSCPQNKPDLFAAKSRRLFTSQLLQQAGYGTNRFFEAVQAHNNVIKSSGIPKFLFQPERLKKIFHTIDLNSKGNYAIEHFIHWLSRYANEQPRYLENYFASKTRPNLSPVCQDFINFCFRHKISLDADRTLQSFSQHNQLLDRAIKKWIENTKRKDEITILGFGLDEGGYEKTIANFLMDREFAKTVSLYGFDPYASKTEGIRYLTPEELSCGMLPKFDLIIARWVLHHVALQHRWESLIQCINQCNHDSMVLIVEHGVLKEGHTLFDKKLYYLLNALFDIVANIGLRPRYFTNSAPNLGADFFIDYLEPQDFVAIQKRLSVRTTQCIDEVGPGFPNQTINCMSITK